MIIDGDTIDNDSVTFKSKRNNDRWRARCFARITRVLMRSHLGRDGSLARFINDTDPDLGGSNGDDGPYDAISPTISNRSNGP